MKKLIYILLFIPSIAFADSVVLWNDAAQVVTNKEVNCDLNTFSGTCGDDVPALSANGTNCSAGSYPLGVDASGNAEDCTDATTEIDSAVSTHTAISDAHHAATVDTDEKVKVDSGATAGYLGAAFNDGVLRSDGTVITYVDGGDFITIGLDGTLKANWDAAYTHVSNNGSDHSFIDQDLTSATGNPTFKGINVDGAAVFNESGADVDWRLETSVRADTISVLGNSSVIGLSTTPRTDWEQGATGYTGFEIGERASFTARNEGSTIPIIFFSANNIHTATGDQYMGNGLAAQYAMVGLASGTGYAHYFRVAPQGVAGNPLTWTDAMTIDESGNVDIMVSLEGGLIQNGGFTANELGLDRDFRVETSILSNTFHVLGNSSVIGVGTDPLTTWETGAAGYSGFQIGEDAAFVARNVGVNSPIILFQANSVHTSTGDKYIDNGTATAYVQNAPATATGTAHFFRRAAQGTAGNALTWIDDMVITHAGDIQLRDGLDIILGTSTGTKIGTATSQKLAFYNATPIVQPTALTSALTQITHTGPSTPDYAIATPIDSSAGAAWGFSTQDEFETIMSVVLNLQTRVDELETKIQSLGLLQ